jgi:hypothetical protein
MRLSAPTKLFIATLSILTLSSCRQTPTPPTEAERNRITGRIEQTMKDYCNEVSEKGLTAEFKTLFSNDSLLFEVAFNQCDLSPLYQLVSEDFEFIFIPAKILSD